MVKKASLSDVIRWSRADLGLGVFMGLARPGLGISKPDPALETQALARPKPYTCHKSQAQARPFILLGQASTVLGFGLFYPLIQARPI